MAQRMFLTRDEAAEKLGISQEEIQQKVDAGQLHEYRDRDQVMFKREDVEALTRSQADEEDDDAEIQLDGGGEGGGISSDSDIIDLMNIGDDEEEESEDPAPADQPAAQSASTGEQSGSEQNSASATGISVFDAEEVDSADPMAQTQVSEDSAAASQPGDGLETLDTEDDDTGSGLLDLTRESDDTSLGAVELLEDADEGDQQQQTHGTTGPSSATGIFDTAGAAQSDEDEDVEQGRIAPVPAYHLEQDDPAGDGLIGGMLIGAFAALVIAAIVVLTGMQGIVSQLTAAFSAQAPWMYPLGLLVAAFVLGGIGFMMGRSRTRPSNS